MISQDRDSRDIEMFRVPPICLDDIPEILLCKFLLHYLLFFEKKNTVEYIVNVTPQKYKK